MKKALKDTSVLVVEDEAILNDAYVAILESEEIKVETTFNGEEALEKLKKFTPDIILLDLRMPVMGGIQFLNLFDKLKPKIASKIIIFTNYDRQDEIKDAFALGATKYMLKAWASPKELIKIIRETA